MTYSEYAEHRLVWAPAEETTAVAMRVDYLGWWSEQLVRDRRGRIKPEFPKQPMSKQRALVKSLGGVVKGRGDQTHYLGIGIVGPMEDSGYRVNLPGVHPESDDPARDLASFLAIGITSQELDIAFVHLTGALASVCTYCGRISVRPEGHAGCRLSRRERGLK